ncbi:hypothetical protein [Microbispora amethystogenes]|nr:hypothetical protein [Microbispora amethystogenes]
MSMRITAPSVVRSLAVAVLASTVPWKASKHFHTDGEMLCPMPGISVET